MPYNGSIGGFTPQNNTYGNNSGGRPQASYGPTTNSNGPMMTNEAIGKYLGFNYFNRTAAIEIGTFGAMAPVPGQNFQRRSRETRVTAIIGFLDLCTLVDICDEVLESLKTAGTFTSTGFRVGVRKDTMIEISNGSNLGLETGIYLAIYKGLDGNNRPNMHDWYQFDNVRIIRGYDPNIGTGKEEISKVGQFKKFRRLVEEAANTFTMAIPHAMKTEYTNERITAFKTLGAIATNLGINMTAEIDKVINGGRRTSESPMVGGASSGGPRPPYGGGSTYTNNPSRSSSVSMNDPVQINLNMDDLNRVSMSQLPS